MRKISIASVVALVLGVVATVEASESDVPARPKTLAPCPTSPNCVSSQETDACHTVEPLAFTSPPQEALMRLQSIIETMPRARVVAVGEGSLHAEFTSLLLRFVDDVDAVVDAEKHVIHIRSASRVGYSDLGANRRRIEAIREAWHIPPATP